MVHKLTWSISPSYIKPLTDLLHMPGRHPQVQLRRDSGATQGRGEGRLRDRRWLHRAHYVCGCVAAVFSCCPCYRAFDWLRHFQAVDTVNDWMTHHPRTIIAFNLWYHIYTLLCADCRAWRVCTRRRRRAQIDGATASRSRREPSPCTSIVDVCRSCLVSGPGQVSRLHNWILRFLTCFAKRIKTWDCSTNMVAFDAWH